MRLRAHDRMHRLRLRQSLRAHVQVTAGDLARELVADLGLSVEAPEPGPLRRRIVQHRQTDLELLTEVAADAGLFWTLRGNVLHLLTLEGTGDPVPLALGQSLLQARVAVSAEGVCRSVETAAWDPWRAEARRGRAAEARVGRSASAEASPEGFSSPGERFLAGEVAQTDAEADALARADLDVRGAREVTLTAVAEGDPRLRPGALVEASGLAGPFTGRFVLCAVDHVLSGDTGFVSELSSAPPAPPRRPDATVAALGVVTRVDDPEELGRVRVSLPAFGDVETDWLEVVVPGAGRGKGIVALPDAEDRVLVLLARGDPAQGVVLGGLYGPLSPPDHGVEGAAVKRYTIRTRAGTRSRWTTARRRCGSRTAAAADWRWHPTACASTRRRTSRSRPPATRWWCVRRGSTSRGAERAVLTEDAVIVCSHELGLVRIEATQDLVTVAARRLLVEVDPEGRPIVGCPNIGVAIKPCTSTLRVQAGYSEWLRISGRRICLDSIRGLTDGTPPGVVDYKVRHPGQDLVAERPR